MRNIVSLLHTSQADNEPISVWVAEELIRAYSDEDDVLERTHSPKQLLDLEMGIAHDLTQLHLIDSGIVL